MSLLIKELLAESFTHDAQNLNEFDCRRGIRISKPTKLISTLNTNCRVEAKLNTQKPISISTEEGDSPAYQQNGPRLKFEKLPFELTRTSSNHSIVSIKEEETPKNHKLENKMNQTKAFILKFYGNSSLNKKVSRKDKRMFYEDIIDPEEEFEIKKASLRCIN